mmetsp:Transcript_7093/g.6292  ORF Transcript_7093/g.6292 Transcript_7093/m.6292 type:complete len:165 (+) Transcript_7093:96-590(+)
MINVKRVGQEYLQVYDQPRSKIHPRVNLPVFKKNRNLKIKVFSVKSKDRNQKWVRAQNNFLERHQNDYNKIIDFKSTKINEIKSDEEYNSALIAHKPKLRLSSQFSDLVRKVKLKPRLKVSNSEDDSLTMKRYNSVNQRESNRYNNSSSRVENKNNSDILSKLE